MSFMFLKILVASSKSSLSFKEPSFILLFILLLILLIRPNNLVGFFINPFNTSFTSVIFSVSISISLVVSSAISLASDPILPLINLLICEKSSSLSGML